MGVLYILSVIVLLVAYLLIKKSEEKLNIIHQIIFSMVLYLGYNILICFALGNLGICTNLYCLAIVNILLSFGIGFIIWKRNEFQKYLFDKKDIIGILLIMLITIFISVKQYRPFDKTVSTASVDGCMHYRAATAFADNMIILSKIDNQTGYNFLTMQPGAYINTGILMSVIRTFSENAKDYVTFKLFETIIFTLNILAFYTLISDYLNTKYKYVIGLVFICLYAFAYPYTSLLYGFSYLSIAIAFCTEMFYIAKIYKSGKNKFWSNLVSIVLLGVGIIFSYCLFVPAMFAFICISVFLNNKNDNHKLFKKETMIVTGILALVTIIGILYLVIPTFLESTQNKLTDAIGFEGGIYKGLFIDFIFYIPFVILFIIKSIKERKVSPILLALIIVGIQAVISFAGLAIGFVSSYYYYKIYYILYVILVDIAVFIFTDTVNNKELQAIFITMLSVFCLLILCVSVEFELRLVMKYPGLVDSIKSNELVGIYYDTNVQGIKNINVSCIVDSGRVEIAEAMGKIDGINLKNMLVGGMNTSCKSWLYVISGINAGGASINELQKAVVETTVQEFLKDENKEYFVLFTGEKMENTDEYTVLFQNNSGVILKKN